MKNVNVYCYLKHGLLEKIKYTGYEIIDANEYKEPVTTFEDVVKREG